MSPTLNKKPNTTFIPVTTMEEVPVLSSSERAELVGTLQQAEADISAGRFVEHKPETFVQDLTKIRDSKLPKKAV